MFVATGPNLKTAWWGEGGETLDVTVACSDCKTQKELLKQNFDVQRRFSGLIKGSTRAAADNPINSLLLFFAE